MRIVLTTDTLGGVWTYATELADALVARGHAVGIAAVGRAPTALQQSWADVRPGVALETIPAQLEWEVEPEHALAASVEPLRRFIAEYRADIVHLNQYYYGACELGVPRLVAGHSEVVGWWQAVRGEEPPDNAWFRRYRQWVADGWRSADARVTPSRWLAAVLADNYGGPPADVVPNGRSGPAGGLGGGRGERRRMLLSCGRLWDEGKGAQDLIAAAPLLADFEISVAGEARHPAGGSDFPTDAAGVHWAGVLDSAEVGALMRRASVYVATSRYEPFGLAPLEAALSGCALLLTDIPTFRELWDGCAAFYQAGEPDDLARQARQLLTDGARRVDFAAAAAARARARYSPDAMAIAYESLYGGLVRHV
jgi:glycogen synthase